MADRCRLCTTNDRDGLVEELAEALWESCRQIELDPAWKNAPPYWQHAMRVHATTSIATLERMRENG
jgi:hypothetical protein